MPGIFGAYRKNRREGLRELTEKMVRAMNHGGDMRIDRYTEEGLGLCLGRVSLGILNATDQPIGDPKGACHIIFHGELYNNEGPSEDPKHVLDLYCEKGDMCACELNGIFHFLIHDKQEEQIKIFSDKFGLLPIYYCLLSDGIVFGAEVKAILEDGRIRRILDYQAFADFYHFGQILGTKTLFQDIRLLDPGSVLTYHLNDGKVDLRKYWDLDDLFGEKKDYRFDSPGKDVVPLLIQSIKARSKNKEILGLSLSGGLDSRAILAGMKEEARGLHTYTLGLPGCADEKLAGRMARVAGTQHEFIPLESDYISNFEAMADGMIRLSDGMYHPHESTEMLALEYFRRAPFRVLLRGHGGEIAKASLAYPVMVTPEVEAASGKEKIMQFISSSTNLVLRDIHPGALFHPEVRDVMTDGARQSLETSIGSAADRLRPADVCIYYYINEHIRRQVVASLEIFRSVIEVRLPYLDEGFLKALLSLPIRSRWAGEVHRKHIQACMPALMKVPDSNTGAPLDAGPFRLYLTDKFNSMMRRLSVSGYRHYTEFQKWHREGFKKHSERIIFSDLTTERDLYNVDVLRTVFEQHISGQKDFGHLLGTIVGMELWFRAFVD